MEINRDMKYKKIFNSLSDLDRESALFAIFSLKSIVESTFDILNSEKCTSQPFYRPFLPSWLQPARLKNNIHLSQPDTKTKPLLVTSTTLRTPTHSKKLHSKRSMARSSIPENN